MTRRSLFPLGVWVGLYTALRAESGPKDAAESLRGQLMIRQGEGPAIRLKDGTVVPLAGDAETVAVLMDQRLATADFEVDGHYLASGVFEVNPRYTDALWVHTNGERMMITYWCDLCAIRTYAPGKCMCCQEETRIDLRKPESR
jgi:hypothetical protein